jgi:hypothetical protein
MPFYHYRQNNSYGAFDFTDKLTANVVIEADSPDQADKRAEQIGLYFDGCSSGIDCPCCGDRWYRASGTSYDSYEFPAVYGTPFDKLIILARGYSKVTHDRAQWLEFGPSGFLVLHSWRNAGEPEIYLYPKDQDTPIPHGFPMSDEEFDEVYQAHMAMLSEKLNAGEPLS